MLAAIRVATNSRWATLTSLKQRQTYPDFTASATMPHPGAGGRLELTGDSTVARQVQRKRADGELATLPPLPGMGMNRGRG
jgi:hypothetical protein